MSDSTRPIPASGPAHPISRLWSPSLPVSRSLVSGRSSLFVLSLLLAIVATSLPIALHDLRGVLIPYTIQGARPLIGESVWFLPAILLEPRLLSELTFPWSGVTSRLITPTITLAGQAIVLLLLGLIQLLRPADIRRTIALAALAPTAFLLLNRVFSPQYALPISAGLLAAGAVLLRDTRAASVLISLIATMQAANLLIWPYTRSDWPFFSALLFATGIGASIWLAILAARQPPNESPPPDRL